MSSFPRHRIACGQTAMDWIDDWEEPDADVAYEPAAYVNKTIGVISPSWRMRKEDQL